jgi:hypothetical protein
MPLHMRMPKRGFNNPIARKLAEVNLWRLAKAIEAASSTPARRWTQTPVKAAGVIRAREDGVRLLGDGEISSALNITVHSATARRGARHRSRRRLGHPDPSGSGRRSRGLTFPIGHPGRRSRPGDLDSPGASFATAGMTVA